MGNFERFEVHVGQAVNQSSANPENISVNISSVAGIVIQLHLDFTMKDSGIMLGW